jgi:hypothetical protein
MMLALLKRRGKRVLPKFSNENFIPGRRRPLSGAKIMINVHFWLRAQVRDLISSETLIFFPLNTPCYESSQAHQ